MEDTGVLTLLMNFVAPALLGAAIAYMLIRTRRVDWNRRAETERATEALYERAEQDRRRNERDE